MTRFFVFSDLHYDHVFDADKRLQMIRKAVEDLDVKWYINRAENIKLEELGR